MFVVAQPLANAITAADPIPWLQPALAVAALLLGSGGVVAWRRLTLDKRIGVAQQEVTEDDSVANRWKAIIEAQTKTLLEPMVTRIGTLESKVTTLETELETSRRKYWSAVTYIRGLLTWIARHLPPDIETTTVPQPPAGLAEDI